MKQRPIREQAASDKYVERKACTWFSWVWCILCPARPQAMNVPRSLVVAGQCAQLELFSHLLNARIEGETTPTQLISRFITWPLSLAKVASKSGCFHTPTKSVFVHWLRWYTFIRQQPYAISMRLVYPLPIPFSAYEPNSLVIAGQCAQPELFSHFLNARTEGETTPTHLFRTL